MHLHIFWQIDAWKLCREADGKYCKIKENMAEKELEQASNLSSPKTRWGLSTLLLASTTTFYLSRQSVLSARNSNY